MNPGRHRLIPLDAPDEWKAALARVPHAFAHTWDNCHAMSLSTGLPTFLYVWERDGGIVVCPLSVREFGGREDLVTPYGFSGFVGAGVVAGMGEAWRGFAVSRGYVCAYVQLNPVLTICADFDAADVHQRGDAYAVDLRVPEEGLYHRLSRNRQREVRDAVPADTEVLMDDPRAAQFFLQRYRTCMRERGASPVYMFRDETLQSLVRSRQMLSVGVARGGTIEAVTLFGWTPHVADSLFNVTVGAGRRHAALQTWHGMMRLKAMGVATLNLGGGVRPGDGVAQFKQRFGAAKLPLNSLRQVFDREAYEALCRESAPASDAGQGFFPPYHRPDGTALHESS